MHNALQTQDELYSSSYAAILILRVLLSVCWSRTSSWHENKKGTEKSESVSAFPRAGVTGVAMFSSKVQRSQLG